MLEKKCLIKFMGEEDSLEKFCRQIEDLGFAYEKTLLIKNLGYEIAVFSYVGKDYSVDKIKIETLGEKVRLEEQKIVRTL